MPKSTLSKGALIHVALLTFTLWIHALPQKDETEAFSRIEGIVVKASSGDPLEGVVLNSN